MNTKEIFIAINNAFTELINTLSLFSNDELNVVPFEGSWTPGQVVQHVIMSVSGFAALLTGPVEDTTRQPDMYVENLRAAFLNFDIKMQSPDFILPPAIDYNKKELLHTLEELRTELNQFNQSLDMTKTCMGFELPVMGYLTRTEAATFILVHIQRHIHQLKNIYQKINNLKQPKNEIH
jgi:hypothetical protein